MRAEGGAKGDERSTAHKESKQSNSHKHDGSRQQPHRSSIAPACAQGESSCSHEGEIASGSRPWRGESFVDVDKSREEDKERRRCSGVYPLEASGEAAGALGDEQRRGLRRGRQAAERLFAPRPLFVGSIEEGHELRALSRSAREHYRATGRASARTKESVRGLNSWASYRRTVGVWPTLTLRNRTSPYSAFCQLRCVVPGTISCLSAEVERTGEDKGPQEERQVPIPALQETVTQCQCNTGQHRLRLCAYEHRRACDPVRDCNDWR